MVKAIFDNITESVRLSDVSKYITSNKSLESISNIEKGIYPVYDASGVSTYINQFDMKENYIAIIKDGSGVGRVQYCKAYSSFIGTLGGIVAQNCNTYYLYSILDNIDFKNYITGATIPHIYYKDYKNIEIPFPQQAVRTQIEHFFRYLDKQCYNTEKTLEYLILLKKAMLQQLFI